jgi:hypothetical protein
MTDAEIIIGLLSLISVLLFLCWFALRAIGGEICFLSSMVRSFFSDYEELNNFEERKRLRTEMEMDRGATEWLAKHPKDSQ